MKALISRAVRQVEYGEWPDPSLQPGEVLVRVAACGICGTDLHVYRGLPVSWPLPGVRGHELAGTVQAWAADVQGFAEGDRVVAQPILHCSTCRRCRAGQTNLCERGKLIGGGRPGGHAQLVAVPAQHLFPVPDHLDLIHAAVAETLATPVRLFRTQAAGLLQSVAIFGGGSQGLLSLLVARRAGASRIALTDVVPYRRALAEALGASLALDPAEGDPVEAILAMTGGDGVDLAIESAGQAATRQQAVQVLRPGGTAVFLALGGEPVPVDLVSVSIKEVNLRGSQAYTDSDFAYALDLLASGAIDVRPLVSSVPLRDGAEMYERLTNDPGSFVKVVLQP